MIHFFLDIGTNKKWLISQLSSVMNGTLVVFFGLIMMELGAADLYTLACYGLIFLSTGIFFVVAPKTPLRSHKPLVVSITLIMVVAGLSYLITESIHLVLLMSIMALIGQDMFSIDLYSELKKISVKRRVLTQQIVAASLALSIITSLITKPTMGLILDNGVKLGILLCIMCSAILLVVCAKEKGQSLPFPTLENGEVKKEAHFLSVLAFFYNAAFLFSNLYFVPRIIREVAELYSLSDSVFFLFGLLTAISTLAALASRKINTGDVFALTLTGYFSGLLFLSLIIGCWFAYLAGKLDLSIIVVIVMTGGHLFAQLSFRVWSIGLMSALPIASDAGNCEVEHKKALAVFMLYKNAGCAFGFLFAAALALFSQPVFAAPVLTALAFLYGLVYLIGLQHLWARSPS